MILELGFVRKGTSTAADGGAWHDEAGCGHGLQLAGIEKTEENLANELCAFFYKFGSTICSWVNNCFRYSVGVI